MHTSKYENRSGIVKVMHTHAKVINGFYRKDFQQ